MITCSPSEPAQIIEALGSLGRVEPIPVDYMFFSCAHFQNLPVMVARKAFPSDYLSSQEDGRLHKDSITLESNPGFSFLLLELELYPFVTEKGLLRRSYRTTSVSYNTQVIGRLITLYTKGVCTLVSPSIDHTPKILLGMYEYFRDDKHQSDVTRPGPAKAWYKPTVNEWMRHWAQGVPGIGPTRADDLLGLFQSPINMVNATIEQLMLVKGVGEPLATRIYKFFRSTYRPRRK